MGYSKMLCIFFLFFLITKFASSFNNNIHKCPKKQIEALLLFKRNLSSISYTNYECQDRLGSDYHPIMMSWNTNSDCCNWDGVTCDDSTGDVIGINVSCGMLSGTIHPNSSLFNLPHLQRLNLAYNDLGGLQIPREIGRFSNSLTHLNLSHCGFSGQVPRDITRLHKLVSLDLSVSIINYFKNFTMRPHVFNNLLQNLTNLEELSLGEVHISSVLPDRLNISSSLKVLNLHSTGLQGKLPHYIFNLHSLETLDLSWNTFTGDIPSKISVNLTHLTFLDLQNNKLNGTLSSWLFTSPSLQYLNLYGNMFSGNVPFDSFDLPSLTFLDLSNNNQLTGQIDVQTFQLLTNLTTLGLGYNNFSGELELDTLLTSLANLELLDLSYSGFSVTTKNTNHYINPGFFYLSLASCKLKVFPNSIRGMKQLFMLDLSNNEIHGRIPHWAGEIGGNNGLSNLDLSHNFITGLPQFQWYGLHELSLQSNLIEGPFPTSICNMSNLSFLDMSNNRFCGLIPQCFGNITSSVIDMRNNSFQGTIPNIYGDCGSLQGLSLNGNQLRGEVPSSLSKCSGLRVLDLGNNHLNGTFPGWLGDLPNLQALVLKSNNFHGHIQPTSTVESPFQSLIVLDLSYNGFVGQLPAKYFQSFNSMKNVVKSSTAPEYLKMGGGIYYSFVVTVKGVNQNFQQISVDYTIIDLSNNTFDGKIPDVIGGLKSLISLNLSHNCLSGPIPHALGNLTEIESLDLSWNQLSGEIPQSLARITTLGVLNLSQNHLMGRIPEGTQFSTFGTAFGGNSGLYGYPLPKREHRSSQQVEDDGEYDDEEESGFTWKVVTLGYGCGTLIGLVIGYLMLSTRKVKWFNTIDDAVQSLVLKKKRRHIYIGK